MEYAFLMQGWLDLFGSFKRAVKHALHPINILNVKWFACCERFDIWRNDPLLHRCVASS